MGSSSFGDSAIGAAISAGGSLISSLIGVNAAKKQAARQQRYNKELAEIQNQYNIAQWERENEYNLPIAQIERLQEAGLNPNLIYGNPSNTAATSPFLTSGNAANMQGLPHLGTAFQSAIDTYVKLKQADNIQADTENKNVQNRILKNTAELNEALFQGTIDLLGWQVRSAAQDYDYKQQYNQLQLKQMQGDLTRINKTNDRLDKELSQMDILTQSMNEDLKIKKVQAFFESDRCQAELRKIQSEINRNNAGVSVSLQQVKSMQYDLFMRKFNQSNEIATNDANAAFAQAKLKGITIENNKASFDLDSMKEFKYVDKALDVGDRIIGGFTDLVGAFCNYTKSTAQPKPRAYTKRRVGSKNDYTETYWEE